MKMRSLVFGVAAFGLLAACGGDESKAANQQAYETVQEGSVAGVTTTIQGPGESLPGITNTNADTTTAFTLDPNAVAQAPQTGSVPPLSAPSSPAPSYDPAPTYSPAPQAPVRQTAPPPRTATQTPREPEREPETPPQTSTASPQPPEREPEPQPTPEPPPTTTTEEEPPPPPPTQTDTEGGNGRQGSVTQAPAPTLSSRA